MENQHRKITGYRELSQEEIDLMNEVKAKGVELAVLIHKINNFNSNTKDEATANAVLGSQANRWVNIGRTDLQTGLMALTRAVAKPEFF